MRATVDIEKQLLDEAEREAARTGRHLSDVVQEGLRLLLNGRPSRSALSELPTFGGSGLASDVDLEDTDGVMDLLNDV